MAISKVELIENSGVTPGSYTSANITVSADGRVTAASNGSGGGGGVNIQTAAAAPTTRSNGLALVAGDLYYNTATQQYFSWNGTAWVPFDQRNVVVTAVGVTAKANDYIVVTAATQTITLPATPLVGACVTIVVAGTWLDTVVARNGSNIMALAQDLTLDKAYAAMQFTYTDATNGWRLN